LAQNPLESKQINGAAAAQSVSVAQTKNQTEPRHTK